MHEWVNERIWGSLVCIDHWFNSLNTEAQQPTQIIAKKQNHVSLLFFCEFAAELWKQTMTHPNL